MKGKRVKKFTEGMKRFRKTDLWIDLMRIVHDGLETIGEINVGERLTFLQYAFSSSFETRRLLELTPEGQEEWRILAGEQRPRVTVFRIFKTLSPRTGREASKLLEKRLDLEFATNLDLALLLEHHPAVLDLGPLYALHHRFEHVLWRAGRDKDGNVQSSLANGLKLKKGTDEPLIPEGAWLLGIRR